MVIVMTDETFQIEWDVPFEITYWQIDEAVEHSLPTGERIVITPKGKYDSEGHVFVTLLDEVISSAKATEVAKGIVNDIVLENFLLVTGQDLESGGVRILEPRPINKREVQGRRKEVSIQKTARYAICARFEASRIKEALMLHQQRQAHERSDEIYRSVKWLKKGYALSEPVDQFLMYWISFNVLYGFFSDWGKQTNRVSINNLLNNHPKDRETVTSLLSKHSEIIEALANSNLTDWYEQTSYGRKLQESLDTNDYRDQLKKTALCLYVVRNQIFHGGAGLKEELDFHSKCSSLLFDLVRMTIVSYASMSSNLNED